MDFYQRYLNRLEITCKHCGVGTGVKVRTPNTPSNYHHIECNVCYKGTCTDTNDYVISSAWENKQNDINWYEK